MPMLSSLLCSGDLNSLALTLFDLTKGWDLRLHKRKVYLSESRAPLKSLLTLFSLFLLRDLLLSRWGMVLALDGQSSLMATWSEALLAKPLSWKVSCLWICVTLLFMLFLSFLQ
jgi:hypothetical protein